MLFDELKNALQTASQKGLWMHNLLVNLFPICRALAAPGNYETLAVLSQYIPLDVVKVPSNTNYFGWTVPREWHPVSSEIIGPTGEVYAKFSDNNLHLVSGTDAINATMTREDLLPHIFSLPEQPDLIPYATSYYHPHWGFCMADIQKKAMPPGNYHVRIDAERVDGNLIYGETVLPGKRDEEVIVSTYICHPSMANDNLSGVVVSTALYQILSEMSDREYTYRFLFLPETIGSICWLAKNEDTVVPKIKAGIVLSCIGDDSAFSYKKSRSNEALIDRIAAHVLDDEDTVFDFNPASGSDERQYCSPGFNLPIGLLSRTYPGQWPYYHTSGDTPERILPSTLANSLQKVVEILAGLEVNSTKVTRTEPRGEPMLSKYDLYHRQNLRRNTNIDEDQELRSAMMWVLNMADGQNQFIDMAEKSSHNIIDLAKISHKLIDVGLLTEERN